jgi:predicted nucleotidyltransferase
MKNKNQQLLNISQQSLGKRHQKTSLNEHLSGNRRKKSGIQGEYTGQGKLNVRSDFIIPYMKLFRRSSFILIIGLGRNYSNKFHVRDLARSLHYDVSMISKNLKQLEEVGLVTHEDVGNLVFYQANMKSVLLRHMKICLTLLELTDLIRDLDQVITNSILYGSCAKGEDTDESDIDLFLETHDKEAVQKILTRHRKKITREMSPIVSTPDETYRLKTKDKILFNNIQQGIILKG